LNLQWSLHNEILHLCYIQYYTRSAAWFTHKSYYTELFATEVYTVTSLSKQLAIIHNSSVNSTHSAQNLGFIFDEHLTFSAQISSVSKSCYYHSPASLYPSIHQFQNSFGHRQLYCPLKLDYCNSLLHFITTCPSLKSLGFNRSRTLLHVLLSKLPNPVTPLSSYGLRTG